MPQKQDFQEKHKLTTDDIIGKEVLDSDGNKIGIIDKIIINSDTLEIESISIDKGFLRKGLSIGKDYISRIGEKAIFLNIRPSFLLRGKIVFDLDGKKIGEVYDIVLRGKTNEIESIKVKSNFFKKTLLVSSALIKEVGENIFLNTTADNIPV